jgi:DNA (cytosine-5)-methyltransferase 1
MQKNRIGSEQSRLAGLRSMFLGPNADPTEADLRLSAQLAGAFIGTNISDLWPAASQVTTGPVKVIDMFSGCGGMSAGFRAANAFAPLFDVCGAVDIDAVANQSYEINHGIKPLCEDLTKLARSPSRIKEFAQSTGFTTGAANILIGCAPCQGFSSHRNQSGAHDPRNSLFVDFAKVAVQLSPDAILVENVPELLTDKYWPYVAAARELLEDAGYFVHVNVHNMAEFGVPQERFRALIVALKRPFGAPSGFLRSDEFQTVRDAIGHLPAIGAGAVHRDDPMHFSAGHKQSTIDTIKRVPKDGGNRPADAGPDCLRRIAAKSGKAAFEDVYGRLAWEKPAITITAHARNPASGRFVHPEQDRGLTVREAATLQGFPSTYAVSGGLDQSFRQIGNAVPPAFAAYLAMHLLGEMLQAPIPTEHFDPGITEPVGPSFSRLIPSLKARARLSCADASVH